MIDFLIGLAFVAMLFAPAIVASRCLRKSDDGEL
jgi:hypothetical protein